LAQPSMNVSTTAMDRSVPADRPIVIRVILPPNYSAILLNLTPSA
jgi:hypothetical protein